MQTEQIAARIPKELKEKIDLAIQKGLYLNLSDLMRTALRELLNKA